MDLMRSAAWGLTILPFLPWWAVVLNCELKSTLSPRSCFCQTVFITTARGKHKTVASSTKLPETLVGAAFSLSTNLGGIDLLASPFQSLNKMFSHLFRSSLSFLSIFFVVFTVHFLFYVYLFLITFYFCVCAHMYIYGHVLSVACIWRSEDNLWEPVTGIELRATDSAAKDFYLLIHFAIPKIYFSVY